MKTIILISSSYDYSFIRKVITNRDITEAEVDALQVNEIEVWVGENPAADYHFNNATWMQGYTGITKARLVEEINRIK